MARGLAEVLGQIDGGEFYSDLNQQLAEMVLACTKLGKAGEMKLTLKIKPNGQNSVQISEAVTFKAPEPARPVTMFFVNTEGSLSRDDPRQQKLPLREVAAEPEKQPLKSVEAERAPLKELANG